MKNLFLFLLLFCLIGYDTLSQNPYIINQQLLVNNGASTNGFNSSRVAGFSGADGSYNAFIEVWSLPVGKSGILFGNPQHQWQGRVEWDQPLQRLSFYSGRNLSMSIKSNGNVGIGTTNPQAKLAVNGLIAAEEISVVPDVQFPDYVFDDDYQKMSLEKLMSFIQENNHLPEIPSAAEVEENGLDLGTFSVLLLKKIEELTLHVIDEHNNNMILSSKLVELEKKINALNTKNN